MNVVSGNGSRCIADANVGQQWLPARRCNEYKHRSTILTADKQCVRT